VVPVLYLLLVYLVAAVPFGLVLTTLYGGDVDVRTAGSGNIGATNVARVYGWRLAGPALGLDLLKGYLPVLLAPFVLDAGLWWATLVGAVAFVGHCWPVYLEFRGGKGVATGAGVMLAIAPVPTLFASVLWGLVLALTGRSSVAALTATVGLVALAAWLRPGVLPVAALLALGIAARHVANIRRLVRGEESQVVRPVRWNRRTDTLTPEEVLAQGPAGTEASVPLWHEPIEDPLEAEGEAAESPTG
jgi:acyl phosphate:glycerol-3-phosphate acyltransferase